VRQLDGARQRDQRCVELAELALQVPDVDEHLHQARVVAPERGDEDVAGAQGVLERAHRVAAHAVGEGQVADQLAERPRGRSRLRLCAGPRLLEQRDRLVEPALPDAQDAELDHARLAELAVDIVERSDRSAQRPLGALVVAQERARDAELTLALREQGMLLAHGGAEDRQRGLELGSGLGVATGVVQRHRQALVVRGHADVRRAMVLGVQRDRPSIRGNRLIRAIHEGEHERGVVGHARLGHVGGVPCRTLGELELRGRLVEPTERGECRRQQAPRDRHVASISAVDRHGHRASQERLRLPVVDEAPREGEGLRRDAVLLRRLGLPRHALELGEVARIAAGLEAQGEIGELLGELCSAVRLVAIAVARARAIDGVGQLRHRVRGEHQRARTRVLEELQQGAQAAARGHQAGAHRGARAALLPLGAPTRRVVVDRGGDRVEALGAGGRVAGQHRGGDRVAAARIPDADHLGRRIPALVPGSTCAPRRGLPRACGDETDDTDRRGGAPSRATRIALELGDERGHVGEALGVVDGHAAAQRSADVGRGVLGRQVAGRTGADGRGHGLDAVAVEGARTREGLEQRHAEAELIGGRGDGCGPILLGGHVRGRADEARGRGRCGRLGARDRIGRARAHLGAFDVDAGETEVGHADPSIAADQDVVGLEVAVDQPALVGRLQTTAGLAVEGDDLPPGSGLELGPLSCGPTIDVLHGDEDLVLPCAGLVDDDDVLVLDAGEGPGLAQEAIGGEGRAGAVDLDGDLAIEDEVMGEEDDAHRAAAELALDAEGGADRRARGEGERDLGRGGELDQPRLDVAVGVERRRMGDLGVRVTTGATTHVRQVRYDILHRASRRYHGT
jgi:hypothetical protein